MEHNQQSLWRNNAVGTALTLSHAKLLVVSLAFALLAIALHERLQSDRAYLQRVLADDSPVDGFGFLAFDGNNIPIPEADFKDKLVVLPGISDHRAQAEFQKWADVKDRIGPKFTVLPIIQSVVGIPGLP